jgi:phosphate transport system substrate-binding protein
MISRPLVVLMATGSLAGLVAAGSVTAGDAPGGGVAPGMVEWLAPPVATSPPQTDAEKAAGMTQGRTLPAREILQPDVDSTLAPYMPRKGVNLSGTFRAAASDVLPGLVRAWIDAFSKLHPGVHIELVPPYAGSLGAQELIAQKLDFVFVSRELRPDDISGFRAKFGYAPLSVPISGGSYRHFGFLDAVAFLVNKDNPIEALSFEQLDAILSRTHVHGGAPITTWGQLGLTGEWADKPIHVYAIKPWNGFEEFVRQRVLSANGQRGEWREDLHFDETVFPIAQHVAQDRYGLGYSGVAYIDAAVKMLPLARAATATFEPPSYESVALASYPLSRLVYVNLNKSPNQPLNPALEEFLRFILSRDGQQLVRDQGILLPLRAAQARTSLALISH